MEKEKTTRQDILVVDDDPAIRALLQHALAIEGYRPEIYMDAEDALRQCESKAFPLAFVDINLPGMSGLDFAHKIKQGTPNCEVVFITGSDSFENAIQAIKIGAYDYLRKPFSLNDLSLCLKRFEERQLLRDRIRIAEQRYFQLVQNIPLIIYVLGRDLALEFVSEACWEILGYAPQEAMNSPGWLLERIHTGDRERVEKAFQSAFDQGTAVSLECRMFHRDGHPIHVLLKSITGQGAMARDPNPLLEGFMVDISDRIILERTLAQREMLEILGAISAEVAHEIRNPLVSIGGYARRLKQKNPELSECDVILRESRRLEQILSRITNYLKPVEVHPQECSVNQIIEECLQIARSDGEGRMVGFQLDLDPDLPTAYLDPEIVKQVFLNLVHTASEAVGEGESLIIKTYGMGRDLQVQFKVRTPGVATMDTKTPFTPFSENGQHTGVPLSYRLLKDIGGSLHTAKEKDDTVFTVSLPTERPDAG